MLINAPAKPSHIKAIISSPLLRSEEGQFFSIFRYLEDVIVATLARNDRCKRAFFVECESQPCCPLLYQRYFSPHSLHRARHYITNIVSSTYKNCILHSLYVSHNEKPPGHLCPGGFSRSLVMKMLIYIKESSPKGSAEI